MAPVETDKLHEVLVSLFMAGVPFEEVERLYPDLRRVYEEKNDDDDD